MLKDSLLEPHQYRELNAQMAVTFAEPRSLGFFIPDGIPPALTRVVDEDTPVHLARIDINQHPPEYFALFETGMTRPDIHRMLNAKYPDSAEISPYEMLYKWQQLAGLPKRVRKQYPEYDRFMQNGKTLRGVFSHNVDLLASHARSKLVPYEQACIDAFRFPYKSLFRDTIYGRFVSPRSVLSVLKREFATFLQETQPDLAREQASRYKRKRGIMYRRYTFEQTDKKFRRLPQPDQEKLWGQFLMVVGDERLQIIAEDFVGQKYRGNDSMKLESGEIILDLDKKDRSWKIEAAPDLVTVTASHEMDLEIDISFPRDPETHRIVKKTTAVRNGKLLIPALRWQEIDGVVRVSPDRLPGLFRSHAARKIQQLIPPGVTFDSALIDSYSGYLLTTLLTQTEINTGEENSPVPWYRGRPTRIPGAITYPVAVLRDNPVKETAGSGFVENLHGFARIHLAG